MVSVFFLFSHQKNGIYSAFMDNYPVDPHPQQPSKNYWISYSIKIFRIEARRTIPLQRAAPKSR